MMGRPASELYDEAERSEGPEKIVLLEGAAAKGHGIARVVLGEMYMTGDGVDQDYRRAAALFEGSNCCGMRRLAHMYHGGLGVPKDDAKALTLLKDAVALGCERAMCTLGQLYAEGSDVLEKDDDEAFRLYTEAAETGYDHAQILLALCYEAGRGVERDHHEAFRLMLGAASNSQRGENTSSANYNLSMYYDEGVGVERDVTESFRRCHLAADAGHGKAILRLAHLYELGRGVERTIPRATEVLELAVLSESGVKDEAEVRLEFIRANARSSPEDLFNRARGTHCCYDTVKLLLEASDRGHVNAMRVLGDMFLDGTDATPRCEKTAVGYFTKAADIGSCCAKNALAQILFQGRGNVPKDAQAAVRLWNEAAVEGCTTAQIWLGDLYRDGCRDGGILKNPQNAVHNYRLAAENNSNHARIELGRLYYDDNPHGGGGTPQEAVDLWVQAAEADPRAHFHLAEAYLAGRGVAKNERTAVKHYHLAAQGGYHRGLMGLAGLYIEGNGVTRDITKGLALLRDAVDKNVTGAQDLLDEILKALDDTEDDNETIEDKVDEDAVRMYEDALDGGGGPFQKKVRPCHYCGVVSTDFKLCGVCRSVRYCSKECQAADWPQHRRRCKHRKSRAAAVKNDDGV